MKKKIRLPLLGLIIGFANGIFGAGGGMLLVPALEKLFGTQEKKSHATTTAIILPLCIVSSFIMIKNYKLDWITILMISLGGMAGGFMGAKFLNKISDAKLKKIFGFFIIIAAIKMIL